MDIFPLPDLLHIVGQPGKIHPSADLLKGSGIRGLHADLQLHQPRAHLPQKLYLLLIQQIPGNLKMKIRHPVVMLQQEAPDFLGPGMAAVEGPIHQFHLGHPVFQEKDQLPLHQLHAAKPQPLVHGGQTVAAGKGAAPAGLIVDDLVGKKL